MKNLLKSYLRIAGLFTCAFAFGQATPDTTIFYGSDSRQYMDIFYGDSDCPTPVFFHAHGNGGNTDMSTDIVTEMNSNGITIVSWESLPSVNTPAEVLTGWNDANLMFDWVKANGSSYNMDTSNFVVGGSSRGSVISWKYSHSAESRIKGLYMYNALPNNAWADSSQWYPPNDVTVNSPEIFFVYKREPGCSTDPIDPDGHDPNNGYTIMNRYFDLGIGEKDTLIHSIIDSASSDRFQYATDFVLSAVDQCISTNIETLSTYKTKVSAFPNPFQNELNFTELKGNETFEILDIHGKVIQKCHQPNDLRLNTLSNGLYILNISGKNEKQSIKLFKSE